MKKFWFVWLLIGVLGAFAACSEDDENGGSLPPDGENTVPSDSIASGDTIPTDSIITFSNRLKEVKIFYLQEEDSTFYQFHYGNSGELVQVVTDFDNDTIRVNYEYGENEVRISSNYEKGTRIYQVEGKTAQSMYKIDEAGDSTFVKYSYSATGELEQVVSKYVRNEMVYLDSTSFEWKEGNLASYDTRFYKNGVIDEEECYQEQYQPSEQVNEYYNFNLNVILTERLTARDFHGNQGMTNFDDFGDFVLGLYGRPSRNLIEYPDAEYQYIEDENLKRVKEIRMVSKIDPEDKMIVKVIYE